MERVDSVAVVIPWQQYSDNTLPQTLNPGQTYFLIFPIWILPL
jgi:hypothetical protein